MILTQFEVSDYYFFSFPSPFSFNRRRILLKAMADCI
jgi:hypothetical protein